jgi:predicted transcriptional regulator
LVQAQRELEFAVRGRMDIMADILDQARHGAKKTRIMYTCNLSFRQLKVYLDFLLIRNFLTLAVSGEEKSRVFRATEKGLAFLESYRDLQAIISS